MTDARIRDTRFGLGESRFLWHKPLFFVNKHRRLLAPVGLLRAPAEQKSRGGSSPDAQKHSAPKTGLEKTIRCKQCGAPITSPDERMVLQGAHEHTFTNPHGIVFHIGCFRSASGCGYTGAPTEEFSWFRGFFWRLALCRQCLTHLGWLFTSSGSLRFHGLILDRLVES